MQVEAPNRGADEGDERRLALFAAFDAMLVMTRSSVPVLIAMLVVEGLALYAAWYLQAGCLKRQFKKALRRGYPGFDHLKL